MLEAELTAHLGYERYAADGRNSGNSRNGKRTRKLRTSAGDTTITIPRDRNGSFESPLLEPYQTSTNELEDKIIALYGKGMSVRDIQATLKDLYGVDVSPTTLSAVTDKVWELVEAWQNRPLAASTRSSTRRHPHQAPTRWQGAEYRGVRRVGYRP